MVIWRMNKEDCFSLSFSPFNVFYLFEKKNYRERERGKEIYPLVYSQIAIITSAGSNSVSSIGVAGSMYLGHLPPPSHMN